MIWPQSSRLSHWRDLLLALLPDRALPYPPDRPKRLLILQPDHLGDLLFATPALRLLRRQLPSTRIEIVVGPWNRRAVTGNRNIDEFLLFEYPWFDRKGNQPLLGRVSRLAELALLIRSRRPDVVLILRADFWWGALAAKLARVRAVVGHTDRQAQGLLTHTLAAQRAYTHVPDLNLALAAFVAHADPTEKRELDFHITEEDRRKAERLLADVSPAEEPLFVIHVGSGSKVKRWAAEHFAAVADELADRHGLRVVLTAGPTETEIARKITSLLKRPALNLAGQTSLGELAALFEVASVVIGADSGPLHLAVAVGTRTVHLFGPASAERYGPYGYPGRHIVIGSNVPCSPCGRLDIQDAALAVHDCVRLITPEQVAAATNRLLADHAAGRLQNGPGET